MTTGRMLTIRALTPIHSGYGQESGDIDQPIAREAITNWPYLNGERIKGVLRDACNDDIDYDGVNPSSFYRLFGPPTTNAADFAGGLMLGDAHLLCFPVRSFFGVFAWITCPLALLRWKDDCEALGQTVSFSVPTQPSANGIWLPEGDSSIKEPGASGSVFLEEYKFTPGADTKGIISGIAEAIATQAFTGDTLWARRFRGRFGILSDDIFTRFVELMTIRSARIRLQEVSKTVASGGLWYEEDVPQQTIFTAPVRVSPRLVKNDDPWSILDERVKTPIQIGGNKSVGRGFAKFGLTVAK